MNPAMSKKTGAKAPRRGRPAMSDAKKEEMKALIAKTAQQLFNEEGYAEISMRRLAQEIGCTPMTLYNYYGGKLDVLQTLWGSVFDDLFRALDALHPEKDPAKYLTTLSTAYVQYWLQHTDHYRLVFMAEGVTQPEVSIFLDNPDIIARFMIFGDALSNASKHGLDQDQLKLKLDLLICVLHGIAHNHITISGYPWSSPDDLVRVAIDGLLAA